MNEQCDEASPRCTRCEEVDMICEYANGHAHQQTVPQLSEGSWIPEDISQLEGFGSDLPSVLQPVSLSPEPGTSTALTVPLPPEPKWPSFEPTTQHTTPPEEDDLGIASAQPSIDVLDSRDLGLFSHYLTHTSRTIPFDQTDTYALQVGFPNLAFGSKPIMSSILALAAACQCHDLLTEAQEQARGTVTRADALSRIEELLALAEQHHTASLSYMQKALPTTSRYDCVLVSAALMVLYGSASHSLRIRLVATYHEQGEDELLPSEFLPVQSRWIFLIRAVHFAYIGLVADAAKNQNATPAGLGDEVNVAYTPPYIVATSPGTGVIGTVPSPGGCGEISSPQDGPSDLTRRLFLPIVAATSGPAMQKLRAKAQRVEAIAGDSLDLQACWEALERLERTVDHIFAEPCADTPPEATESEHILPDVVAPWLRTYTARVTSNNGVSSNPYRRTISSFLNRVPEAYVQLVQTTLDAIPPSDTGSEAGLTGIIPGQGVAHHLAVDIFAHWLVLELLLDGVWWIGETGSWELGRAVTFTRRSGWLEKMVEDGESAWWPESMYKIRTEVMKQAI